MSPTSIKNHKQSRRNTITYLVSALLLALGAHSLFADSCSSNGCSNESSNTSCYCLSRSVFIPRSISQDATFELASNFYNTYYGKLHNQKTTKENHPGGKKKELTNNHDDGKAFSFYFAYSSFYQQTSSGDELAKYFFPGCKNSILVAEDGIGDVNPIWFNTVSGPLDTGDLTFYRSRVSICPERKTYGANFFLNGYITDYLWGRINTAVVYATHELHLKECVREHEGAIEGFEDMFDGLGNPELCYSKWCNKKQSRLGLDDIQFKLGYDFIQNDTSHLALYLRGTAPTGRKPLSRYMFEPLIGTRHGALGAGINGSYQFYETGDKSVYGLFDLSYSYAFKATEQRTFDLTSNGNWSRYLQIVHQDEPRNSLPATKLLTMDAQVTPRDTVQLFAALHGQSGSWNGELGYNLWWRNSEKVCVCTELPDGYGIFDLNSICSGETTTASTSRIEQGILGHQPIKSNDKFVSITTTDINPTSAAHPRTLSNKVYGVFNYDFECCDRFATIGLGGSYEFGKDLAAMDQWALWLNFGLSL